MKLPTNTDLYAVNVYRNKSESCLTQCMQLKLFMFNCVQLSLYYELVEDLYVYCLINCRYSYGKFNLE